MFPIMTANTPSGYFLQRSLRFRASASARLVRTFATPTDQNKWTLSFWIKPSTIVSNTPTIIGADTSASTALDFTTNATLEFGWSGGQLITNQVFKDPSAWYYILVNADTTNATVSNRMKMFVNGAEVTSFLTDNRSALGSGSLKLNSAVPTHIGTNPAAARYLDGYLAEMYFIDGQALTPSSFGSYNSTTGVWQPAKYTGTYGTNGFYLPFTDNSALTTSSNVGLGKDFSGNGNYWTTNNISITAGTTYDSMTDVPTLTSATAANFAVLNPLHNPNTSIVTYSNANLSYSYSAGSANQQAVVSSIAITSGKFYWEFTEGSSVNSFIGITTGIVYGGTGNGAQYAATGGGISGASAATYSGTALTTAAGNVVGIAFDAGALTLAVYKNNVLQGTFSGIESGKTWFMLVASYSGGSAGNGSINFGQQPFTYTPPSGFVALNTYNLPDSTIKQGNKVMDATLYTGNLVGQVITNAASFQPDLVWVKSRSAATDNKLTDSVRGATKALVSNSTAAETTDITGVVSLNSNGFTLGTSTTYNNLAATYVGWQWQAGQGSTSSNTNGTITSTVSVNASAGFSVVTYTANGTAGSTFGHGLGVAPAFVILKSRSVGATDWFIYHQSLGATNGMYLNLANPSASSPGFWNNTAPSSTVVTVGSSSSINTNGSNNVAYCFAEIAGFSKFGNYSGNGSADGTFVYTGFRPKAIVLVNASSAENWRILDTARNPSNVVNAELYPSLSNAEATNTVIDILSNGFKIRTTSSAYNTSGNNYIYAAWAENPFKNSLAR